MATWETFEQEAPELAAAVRARFEAETHHVLATLRSDGAPRVSGTEVVLRGGQLLLGGMPGARKARDLQRDGRCAIHANPGPGQEMVGGDAKVSGVARELTGDERAAAAGDDGGGDAHWFAIDLTDAVATKPENNVLVIRWWHPGGGEHRAERA